MAPRIKSPKAALLGLLTLAMVFALLPSSREARAATAPAWAETQLQLIDETGAFIAKLKSFQKADGSLFSETSFWSADDEIEYFYYFPAYIYASGDQNAYDFYSDEVMYYWHNIMQGDDNNGYFGSATFDTEHTLEALMGLANLSYIDPTDTEITSRLEDLMEHVGNWDSSAADWYNWSTHHMLSTKLGTNSVYTGCPEGIDSTWNLRFIPMAIAAYLDPYASSNNSRYDTWIQDSLRGWIDAKDRMQASYGFDVIPSSVNPATGEPGHCGEWYTGVAGSWSDGGFPYNRAIRQAFVGYGMLSEGALYFDTAKEMITDLFRLGDGTCPASEYDGSRWIVDCEDDHLARFAVQTAAHDGVEDAQFDALLNKWFYSGRINEPIVDLWKYRQSQDTSMIVNQYLQPALNDIRGKMNKLNGIDNNAEFQAYLRDNCSGKNMGDKLISCFSIEKQATAIAFSAFLGFRPNEADLPEMEVKFSGSDGSLGLPQGVAALVLSADQNSKLFQLYNNTSQTQTMRVQAGYLPHEIVDLRINGSPSNAFDVTEATVTIPAESLVEVEIILGSHNPQCTADLNDDGKIDEGDVVFMINTVVQGSSNNPCADINEDGKYNSLDLQEVINAVMNR